MKRILCLFLTAAMIFLLVSYVTAFQEDDLSKEISPVNSGNTMAGFTLGNFRVASDRFKEIFGNKGTVAGIEASHILDSNKNNSLGVTLEVRSFSKSGHSTITHKNTFFSMTPVSLTGKYIVNKGDFGPYIGAGIDLFFYKEKSSIENASGMTPGIHLEGGAYYRLPLFEFIKIRAMLRFSRAVAKENTFKVNIGGFEFGVGILYCFNI